MICFTLMLCFAAPEEGNLNEKGRRGWGALLPFPCQDLAVILDLLLSCASFCICWASKPMEAGMKNQNNIAKKGYQTSANAGMELMVSIIHRGMQ